MAYTATITLTTAGAGTGPFNLYSNTDGYVTAFASSVSKASLVAGYTTSAVPTGTTIIRVKSAGSCVNYVDLTVSGLAAPILEYTFSEISGSPGRMTIYYNNTSTTVTTSVVSSEITLNSAYTISSTVINPDDNGVTIDYSLNGSYVTSYYGTGDASVPAISPTSGNRYLFAGYIGVL